MSDLFTYSVLHRHENLITSAFPTREMRDEAMRQWMLDELDGSSVENPEQKSNEELMADVILVSSGAKQVFTEDDVPYYPEPAEPHLQRAARYGIKAPIEMWVLWDNNTWDAEHIVSIRADTPPSLIEQTAVEALEQKMRQVEGIVAMGVYAYSDDPEEWETYNEPEAWDAWREEEEQDN